MWELPAFQTLSVLLGFTVVSTWLGLCGHNLFKCTKLLGNRPGVGKPLGMFRKAVAKIAYITWQRSLSLAITSIAEDSEDSHEEGPRECAGEATGFAAQAAATRPPPLGLLQATW